MLLRSTAGYCEIWCSMNLQVQVKIQNRVARATFVMDDPVQKILAALLGSYNAFNKNNFLN